MTTEYSFDGGMKNCLDYKTDNLIMWRYCICVVLEISFYNYSCPHTHTHSWHDPIYITIDIIYGYLPTRIGHYVLHFMVKRKAHKIQCTSIIYMNIKDYHKQFANQFLLFLNLANIYFLNKINKVIVKGWYTIRLLKGKDCLWSLWHHEKQIR